MMNVLDLWIEQVELKLNSNIEYHDKLKMNINKCNTLMMNVM